MKFAQVVATSQRVASTRSRLAKVSELAELLRVASSDELELVVSFLSGKLRDGRAGIGYAAVDSARTGMPPEPVEPSLEVVEVGRAMEELRGISGVGSNQRRARRLRDLFARATSEERDFLGRLLLEDLRQGSLEGIMVDAAAKAASVSPAELRRAWMLSNDLGRATRRAFEEGAEGLAAIGVEMMRPVRPMLAQTAEDIGTALDTLPSAALEHKLDGARIQVHRAKNQVQVFTRRLNDVTAACPELVELLLRLEAAEIILDGEAIALRRNGRPHPFQTTMRRFGRRLDVEAMRRVLPLSAFFFDCLFLNGESLLELGAAERYRRLCTVLPENARIPRIVTDDRDEAERFLEAAIAAGHEGVMVKALDAPYEAGARGKSWLKVKSAHTLDLVVLAAEWGSGRRQGFLSNLHLGARDVDRGDFVMLGKTFKGMTDEVLAWQTERLLAIERERDRHTVYVQPELVAEIAYNDIQRSPHYPSGMALRFARLKAYREDKSVNEADSIEHVRELFRQQTGEATRSGPKQLSLLPSRDPEDL